MRNNAAYLPESPIVYIILPKSIRNRASFAIFAYAKTGGGSAKPKTENVVFLFVSALAFH